MIRFDKKGLTIVIICMLSLLVACQDINNKNVNDSRSDTIKLKDTGNQKKEGSSRLADEQPELEGGSEKDTREPHPVSNSKLQERYPNIVVLHGSKNQNKVALTFDDGPDTRFTPKVLDVLKNHNVKATFFLVGSRAKAHQDLVKRIHNEEHVIGNHTFWHPNLPKEELGRLDWELTETENVLENIIDYKPHLFRSPYGALNEKMVQVLGEKQNIAIGWNVDSLDWKQLDADEISDNVLSNVSFGSIILMHDGGIGRRTCREQLKP